MDVEKLTLESGRSCIWRRNAQDSCTLSTIEQNYTGEVANRYSRGSQELGFIEKVYLSHFAICVTASLMVKFTPACLQVKVMI